GLPRSSAGTARADLGALHLEERLRADRVLRGSVQLAPVPGELDRPGALRVAPLELVPCAERRRRRALADAPEGGLRGVRVRLPLPAHPRGPVGAGRALDGRPLLPLAELLVHGRPL